MTQNARNRLVEVSNDMLQWSIEQTIDWLQKTVDCATTRAIFRREHIDGLCLFLLWTANDRRTLERIGVPEPVIELILGKLDEKFKHRQ